MKIKNYIPVILCSIALCSCSDADKNIAFGLDSDAIKAEAAGGSHKIEVSASGDWVATIFYVPFLMYYLYIPQKQEK